MMFMAFELFGLVGVIIAVVAVAFSVIWVVFGYKGLRLGSRYLRTKEKDDSARAIEILKERYAKGEITKEQFESMMRELNHR
jgi:putative membrane protein